MHNSFAWLNSSPRTGRPVIRDPLKTSSRLIERHRPTSARSFPHHQPTVVNSTKHRFFSYFNIFNTSFLQILQPSELDQCSAAEKKSEGKKRTSKALKLPTDIQHGRAFTIRLDLRSAPPPPPPLPLPGANEKTNPLSAVSFMRTDLIELVCMAVVVVILR